MGKTTTPAVKRQIGATTINIDSKDIRKIWSYLQIAVFVFKVMRIYIYFVIIASKLILFINQKRKKD